MERSTEIVYDFLKPWARLDTVLKACQHILVNTDHASVHARAYATATEYLLAERGRVLKKYWDEMDAVPGLTEVDEVNPDPSVIMKLNGICGFYGADRVIIHLYLHMYLINMIGDGRYAADIAEMNALIDGYFRP